MFVPVAKCHRWAPLFASSAIRLPSRTAANNTLLAVASTPLVSEPCEILKSHIVFPVSGSSALMPADAGGSPAFGAAAAPVRGVTRPMYCRPASYVTGELTYGCPPSRYSRDSQPVSAL